MSFGFGFGFTKITAAIRAAFSPSSLFAANEPGVWYDPSDLSTLFQGSAGTVPVTAVEQPVGLMLDKSKGLALGPELVTNGDFSNGSTNWSLNSWVVSGGVATANNISNASLRQSISLPSGSLYKIKFTISNYSSGNATIVFTGGVGSDYSATVSGNGEKTLLLKSSGARTSFVIYCSTSSSYSVDNISVRELPGNHAYQTTATSRPVLSARVNQYLATETLATQNVTTLAAYYHLRFGGTGTITLSGTATGVYSAGLHLIPCAAGTLTSTVSGSVTKADLRVANDGANLPPYQRVNTATDYDTVGFPHYLRFDGVDDWLVTNTITPGTDKAQVFAGVRKLNDAAGNGMLVETGDTYWTVNGFSVQAPTASTDAGASSPFANYYAVVGDGRGSTNEDFDVFNTQNVYPSPSTNTISAVFDRGAAPLSKTNLRVNGVVPTKVTGSFTGTAVTGNVLNTPLYIGCRAGTLFPFNGHLYSLIVRFGSNLPAATIEKTEKYINAKTRAY